MTGTTIRGLFSDAPETELPDATEAESGLRRLPEVELEDDLFGDLPTLVRDDPANDVGDLGLADVLEPVKPPPVPEAALRAAPTSLRALVRSARPVEPSMIDLDAVMRVTLPAPTVTVDAAPSKAKARARIAATGAVVALFATAGYLAAHLASSASESGAPEVPAVAQSTVETTAPAAETATPATTTEAPVARAATRSPEPELASVTLPDVVVRVPRASAPAARPAPAPAARAARTTAAVAPSATSLPETPSREQVLASLRPFEDRVRACADGYFGVAAVRIVAQPSGRVTTATVTEGSVVGTPAGSCIARTLRGARFPAFSAERFVVQYPFQL